MRKLRSLAVMAFAIFAISAMASTRAMADYHIESASGGSISGTQQTMNEFFTEVGTLKCVGATFAGEQNSETASVLTVHPSYTGCRLGGQKVTIATSGCNYEFQEPTTGPPITAGARIVCEGSNLITINDTAGLGCEVKVGPQGPISNVSFTNHPIIGGVTESGKVLATAELGGIAYSWTAGCPNAGGMAGSAITGKYIGSVLFSGSSPIAVGPTSTFVGYRIGSASGGTISGSQQTKNEFFTEVGTLKCGGATFSGEQKSETAATLTVHPEYSVCSLGGQKVTITTTGCNYEFQEPTTGPSITAGARIVCEGSNLILIKDTAGLGCEVKVGPQGPISAVSFTNNPVIGEVTAFGKVLATAELGGIAYSWTAGCPNAGGKAGSATSGEYNGTVLFTGTSPIAVAAAIAPPGYHIGSKAGGTINGTQQATNEFTTSIGWVSCTSATFSGSQAAETASTLTVHPSYTGCTLSGLNVTVTTTGCNYEFQEPTTGPPITAAARIVCSGSNAILIEDTWGLGCEVKVGQQGPLSGVSYENEAGGKVLMTASVSGIAYSWTAGCLNSGGKAGSGTNGKWTGSVSLTGSSALSVT